MSLIRSSQTKAGKKRYKQIEEFEDRSNIFGGSGRTAQLRRRHFLGYRSRFVNGNLVTHPSPSQKAYNSRERERERENLREIKQFRRKLEKDERD